MNEISNKSENLLTNKVTLAYYEFIELTLYRASLRSVHDARDIADEYIQKLLFFYNLEDIDETTNTLNQQIFNIKKNKKMSFFAFDDIDGFKLLDLSVPFTLEELKTAYKNAAKIHHPDMGGSTEIMQILNETFDCLNDFLLNDEYSNILSEQQNQNSFYDFNDGNDFLFFVYIHLFSVYFDLWLIEEANTVLEKIMQLNFFNSNATKRYSECLGRIMEFLDYLAFVNKKKEAENIVSFLREDLKRNPKKNSFFIKYFKSWTIERARKKLTPKHRILLRNAYERGYISEKSYLKNIGEIDNIDQKKQEAKQNLQNLSKTYVFLKLPFDLGIFLKPYSRLVPSPSMSESKNIIHLTPNQRTAYSYAFQIDPSVELIQRYMYVRICSYLKSIELIDSEERNEFIKAVLYECKLIEQIYVEEIIVDKNFLNHFRTFQDDIMSIIDNATLFESVFLKYYELLPMFVRQKNTHMTFTFREDDTELYQVKKLK